ncbi:MAG: hypothetical protein MZV63_12220 [Marinilabiliales bacterium]|nr:hypothetical protein [Marinilabiliales bacterium]
MIERVGFYVQADSPWKTHEGLHGGCEAESRQIHLRHHAGVGGIHHATMLVDGEAGGHPPDRTCRTRGARRTWPPWPEAT